MHPTFTLSLACALSALMPLQVISAQEAEPRPPQAPKPKKEELPSARLFMIAFGPKPQRRYTIPNKGMQKDLEKQWKDAMRDARGLAGGPESGPAVDVKMPDFSLPVMLPPVKGTVPNTSYQFKVPKKRSEIKGPEDEPFKWERLSCGFNQPSAPKKIEAGRAHQLYLANEGGAAPTKSFKIPSLPPYTQSFIFMTPRRITEKSWLAPPKLKLISLQDEKFKGKAAYVTNFSTVPVVFQFGTNDAVELQPGDERTFSVSSNKLQPLSAIAKMADGDHILMRTAVKVSADSFRIVAFYSANPKTNGGVTVGTFNRSYIRIGEKKLKENMPNPDAR